MNADDPRLTAYMLDELGPEDREEVELWLREQPELMAEMESLRHFSSKIRVSLQAETAAGLTNEQRRVVLAMDQVTNLVEISPAARWWRSWGLSIAAAIVIVGMAAAMFFPVVGSSARSFARVLGSGESAGNPLLRDNLPPAPSPRTDGEIPVNSTPRTGGELALETDTTTGGDLALGPSGFGAFAGEFIPLGDPAANGGAGILIGHGLLPAPWNQPILLVPPRSAYMLQPGTISVGPLTLAPEGGSDEGAPAEPTGQGMRLNDTPATAANPAHPSEGGANATEEVFFNRPPPQNARQAIASRVKGRPSGRGVHIAMGSPVNGFVPQGMTRSSRSSDYAPDADEFAVDNPFRVVRDYPLSTFAAEVDSASYANVRRMLSRNIRPPRGAVRIEELINYFEYNYPAPTGDVPFSCVMEVAGCPWDSEHRLVRIGLKAREVPNAARPPANLVFLVDVSNSMQPDEKLPLLKESLRLLAEEMRAEDSMSIVVYGGAGGTVLEPTNDRRKIRAALDRLEAGGPTNGAEGLRLAYDLAQRAYKRGGSNRVVLCTDGNLNVGITSQSELLSVVEGKARTGISLSCLGVGMAEYQYAPMERLAARGGGHHEFIDSAREGRRVLVEQLNGMFVTVASDVKLQVEFNPAQVTAYRLIGYENRLLAPDAFNDDAQRGGEIGAGHAVTALYEIVPVGKPLPGSIPPVDELRYKDALAAVQAGVNPQNSDVAAELMTLKVRYKRPGTSTSRKVDFSLKDNGATFDHSSEDFRWAASVAAFGMMLRDSPYRGSTNWSMITNIATSARGVDRSGYRGEFLQLVKRAQELLR